MATAQHSGWRTLDVTIPTGAGGASAAIQLAANEVLVAVITPSDWVTSDIEGQITPDNGSTWVTIYSGAATTQKYFTPTQASRAFFYSSGLSHIALRHFKLVSINSQTATKTLTLVIVER